MLKKLLFFLFTILMSINIIAGEVTITPSNCGWTTAQEVQNGTVDCITTTLTKGTVGTDGSGSTMRIYKNETLTISSDSIITSIVFTCTANGTTKYGPGCFAEQEGYTFDENGKTGTWTGNAKSVTFTASSNQVRATNILIMFTKDTTPQDTTIIPPVVLTQLDTITCDSARIAALAGKTDSVLVKGFVTEIAGAYSDQYHNISLWMADTENGGYVFEAFRVACETEEEAPNVGDLVWVKGKLTKYHDTVPELAAGGKFGIILRSDVDTTSQDTITHVVPENIMAPGENANNATVNDKPAVKVGTAKKVGVMTITVPSNAAKLTLYAAAWKAEDGTEITITPSDKINPSSIVLTSDDGITNNSPFTLAGSEEDFKYELNLVGLTEETVFTVTAAKRFVIWNATYETASTPTDLTNAEANKKSYKMFDGKQVIIVRGDKKFNILGQEL